MAGLIQTQVAVIGAGSAGITFALQVADEGVQVDLYTKERTAFSYPESSSSVLLAGGYAAVPFENGIPLSGDSLETHVQDTLTVGGGLNSEKAVRHYIRSFPRVIQWLEERGIQFDEDLHSEGSHSASRVYHVSDRTGQTVMTRLGELANAHPNITVHANHMVIDLISENKTEGVSASLDSCLGAYVLDMNTNSVKTVRSDATVVATGGLGKVFMYTTNPDTASGDGFAMCYRMGLPLVNMEFVQFHPTVHYDPEASKESERRVLFTEALRGAGAFLKLDREDTEDFVLKYDPRGSRASRDVVTRAEDIEMRKRGLEFVWLDCTAIQLEEFKTGFQSFYDFCVEKGIDPSVDSVPVVYAAHYSNGGVLVNLDGETLYPDGTGVRNLYVVGETAYTGLHGATRLASNSGPEAIAISLSAASRYLKRLQGRPQQRRVPLWDTGNATASGERERLEEYWDGIRRTMTKKCGVARDAESLEEAVADMEKFGRRLNRYYWGYFLERDTLEVRNIQEVSALILESALFRKETRACHSRTDYPEMDSEYEAWTFVKKGEGAFLSSISNSPAEMGVSDS
jgi:L-aspartate oxidase